MTAILILKTGALGDVLRTTALLPGIHDVHPGASVSWVTAHEAVALVRLHPQVGDVMAIDPGSEDELAGLGDWLALSSWDWVISLDDEEPLCKLATKLGAARLSGAFWDEASGPSGSTGARAYTEDSAPWFEMGLISVHGKEEADRRKLANRRSHPELLCSMLGLPTGEPLLPADPVSEAAVEARLGELGDLGAAGSAGSPLIGLNTGAGGRWTSKALPVERVGALVRELHERLEGRVRFLLLGGRDEAERNRAIADAIGTGPRWIDGGTDNSLLEFSALVARCSLLISSDSLALHVGVGRRVPVVAFFAPTSAAEIELYGRGEKVVSTSPDYCNYKPDADTSTLTVERLADAVERQLAETCREVPGS